jgi:hypothetical protein
MKMPFTAKQPPPEPVTLEELEQRCELAHMAYQAAVRECNRWEFGTDAEATQRRERGGFEAEAAELYAAVFAARERAENLLVALNAARLRHAADHPDPVSPRQKSEDAAEAARLARLRRDLQSLGIELKVP